MLLSVFTPVYEALIGANPLNPEYHDGIFSSVGLVSVFITLVFAMVYYAVFGRWKPVFHKLWHWLLTLSLAGIFCFVVAYRFSGSEIGMTDAYTLKFACINMLYMVLLFVLLSILLRRVSIYAKHTPF